VTRAVLAVFSLLLSLEAPFKGIRDGTPQSVVHSGTRWSGASSAASVEGWTVLSRDAS
jgi:hypothetical protein